ncbi:M23 family metallopeptidase [Candidatus Mycosynbacter amalyticus]|nr:M23 family metallopeptidase [Candidatus Mycosynbacter amalyticus]
MPQDEQRSPGNIRLEEQGLWYDQEKKRAATLAHADGEAAARTEAARLAQQTKPPETRAPKRSGGSKRRFTGFFQGMRRKSPAIAIALFIAGGSSAVIVSLAPGTPLLMMADILDRDLNTQLSGVDKTTSQLWRNKLSTATKGSCGAVKIACRYETVNMEKMEKTLGRINASSDDKLMMTFDEDKGFTEKRGRIKTISVVKADGTRIEANSPEAFTKLMKSDPVFRAKMYMVYSPRFSVYKGKEIMDFLSKNKVTYAMGEKKNTVKEVQEETDKRVSGETDIETSKLTPVKDKDGNETGEFEDEDGRRYSAAEAKAIEDFGKQLDASPSVGAVSDTIGKAAGRVNALDTACTVFNTATAVRVAARVLQYKEMIRLAFYNVFQPASMLRAETSYPEAVEAPSNRLMDAAPATKVADQSKIGETPYGSDLPEVVSPDSGKNAFDSPLVKGSRDQDFGGVKNMSQQGKALLLGGDRLAGIGNAQQLVARMTGASSTAEVSQRCRVVQNNFVRAGVLAVSIAVGVGTFGAGTAAQLGLSVAFGAAMPLLTAQLASIAAGSVTKGLKYTDFGTATAVGSDAMYNGMARSQGMMSLSPDKMTKYQNSKRETLQAYDELDRLAAVKKPFDTSNKFSFLGSLARTTLPIAASLRTIDSTHLGGALAALPSVATTAMSTVAMPLTHADSDYIVKKDRYTYCNDPDYAQLGPNVAINPTCVMVFGLPDEAMEIDPVENAKWMAEHGEIIVDSDSGDPADNGQLWNYKKYLEQCVDQQPGATEDIEKDPTNGSGCVAEANYEKNWHYAKFKLSLGINEGLDQNLPGMDGGSQEAFDGGAAGKVGLDGWAYPTVKSKTEVSSGFGMRDGTRHNGIDLAGPLGTPIYAARDGKVIAAGPANGFGNWVVIQHEVDGQRVDTVYGHMRANTILVKVGDTVKAGQPIAGIGSEGQSTGPHLHFEIWPGGRSDTNSGTGQPIDPKPYLDKASGGSG